MMICQLAGCLKICKNCQDKESCKRKGVCTSIYETIDGLKCRKYKKQKVANILTKKC